MKHLYTLLLCSLFCSNPLVAQHTEYYSTIRFVETPLSKIDGSVPIPKHEALTRHHYRFNYSKSNQLDSIEFFNGNTKKEPNHTGSLFTLAHRMEFKRTNNSEIISFYSTNREPINVLGSISSFVYNLNKNGLRESLFFEDALGNRVENSWGIYRYKWEYTRDGYVIEDRFNELGERASIRPNFEFYRLKLFFGPNGDIRLMQNIDDQGDLIENSSGAAQDLITVNAEGNFIKWEVLDKEGNLEKGNGPDVAVGFQTFSKYGYQTSLENQDEFGNTIFSNYGFAKSLSSYDKFGNLSARTFIGLDTTPAPHKNAGYTHLKIQYDPTGNFRTRIAYFDEDSIPILHKTRGFAIANYTYNAENQLIRIEYTDTNNNLVNRLDNGASIIKYIYDQEGKKTDTILLDKNAEVVK